MDFATGPCLHIRCAFHVYGVLDEQVSVVEVARSGLDTNLGSPSSLLCDRFQGRLEGLEGNVFHGSPLRHERGGAFGMKPFLLFFMHMYIYESSRLDKANLHLSTSLLARSAGSATQPKATMEMVVMETYASQM